jgi:PAS domain S-box-containing protein
MFGKIKDRRYYKFGVHVVSFLITGILFLSAYLYSLSHEKEFFEIVKDELSNYGKNKISSLQYSLNKTAEIIKNDINHFFVIYTLDKLDTVKKDDAEVQKVLDIFIKKFESDNFGFVLLKNSSNQPIFSYNTKEYPVDFVIDEVDKYYCNNGATIWRNLLIYSDYNFTINIPIINYKNKIIAYFVAGIKSDLIFGELSNMEILGDKKVSILLINQKSNKIIYASQHDLVDLDFIKDQANYKKELAKDVKILKYKNNREILLFSQKVNNSNWVAIFTLDSSNLNDHLSKTSKIVMISALILGILTFLIIEIIFNKITKKTLSDISELEKEKIGLERLKEIVESSLLEVQILIDQNGMILAHNKNIANIFGIKGSLNNTDFRVLIKDSERDKLLNNITKNNEVNKGVYKSICVKKDGTYFNVNIEAESFVFAKVNYYYLFIQDITKLEEYEYKIYESERMFKTLLSNMPGISYRCKIDENWTMEFLSDGCYNLTGYKPSELLNNNLKSYNDLILEEYRDEIFNYTLEAVKNHKQFNYEYRILTKDNKIKWVYEKGVAIYDDKGKPIYLEGFIEDITDRKEFENRLKTSREKYLSIFENSAAGKTIMTVEGVFIEVNNSFCSMLGYLKEEIIGESYIKFTHPDDILKSKNALRTTLENRNLNYFLVKRYIHKNGNPVYVKVSLTAQYDKDKNPVYLITDVLDITTELKIKTELAESEERYKLLAESAQEGIFLLNKDYTLEFINFYAARLINPYKQPEELLKHKQYKSIFNISHNILNDAFNNKNSINVESIVFLDGRKIYLETKLVPIVDEKNRVKALLGVARDETESRNLLEKLDESTKMLHTIINSVPQRIFWKDKNLIYLGGNLNFAKDAGFDSVDEIIGKTDYDLAWEELAEEYRADDKNVIENNVAMINKTEALKKADGSKIWISTDKVPLKNIKGEIIGVLGIYQDITEKKLFEEQLQDMLYKLETSNKNLEQFAYIASHDLQEPLRMVASYTQLLELKYKDKLDEQANQYIFYAVDGAKRMQKLIDDLLEYSRVTTRGKELTCVSLAEVMGKVMVSLSSKINESGAIIINSNLPKVLGDETQLIRVFQNLIDNSIKYSGDKQPTIFISAEDYEDKYLIKVKDNGIGIPIEYKDRIFEIFERLHSTKDYPGTGIGLAICKRIIERHGGRIWLDDTITEGAQFCFTLIKGEK